MPRWPPDARRRLRDAAMDLYVERGYDETTVADIAELAGLTPRTFFRYFGDKREVVFDESGQLLDVLASAMADAPADADPVDAVSVALQAVAAAIGGDHDYSRRRQAVIMANAPLRERELNKMSDWSHTLAAGLRQRRLDPTAARLLAETGVAVFRVAFDRWLTGSGRPGLAATVRRAFVQLRSVTGAPVA